MTSPLLYQLQCRRGTYWSSFENNEPYCYSLFLHGILFLMICCVMNVAVQNPNRETGYICFELGAPGQNAENTDNKSNSPYSNFSSHKRKRSLHESPILNKRQDEIASEKQSPLEIGLSKAMQKLRSKQASDLRKTGSASVKHEAECKRKSTGSEQQFSNSSIKPLPLTKSTDIPANTRISNHPDNIQSDLQGAPNSKFKLQATRSSIQNPSSDKMILTGRTLQQDGFLKGSSGIHRASASMPAGASKGNAGKGSGKRLSGEIPLCFLAMYDSPLVNETTLPGFRDFEQATIAKSQSQRFLGEGNELASSAFHTKARYYAALSSSKVSTLPKTCGTLCTKAECAALMQQERECKEFLKESLNYHDTGCHSIYQGYLNSAGILLSDGNYLAARELLIETTGTGKPSARFFYVQGYSCHLATVCELLVYIESSLGNTKSAEHYASMVRSQFQNLPEKFRREELNLLKDLLKMRYGRDWSYRKELDASSYN